MMSLTGSYAKDYNKYDSSALFAESLLSQPTKPNDDYLRVFTALSTGKIKIKICCKIL